MSRDRASQLRYEISADDYDRLQRTFVSSAESVERACYLKVYLDTPDEALRKQGLAWCFSRKEKWRGGRIKPGDWRVDVESDARSFVKKHRLRHSIGGVFTLRLDQDEVVLRSGDSAIDFALERACLRNGAQSRVCFEAKVALRSGEETALQQFLSENLPEATPVAMPLVEQGYHLTESVMSAEPATLSVNIPQKKSEPAFNVAETFLSVARAKLVEAADEPHPADFEGVEKNIRRAREVRVALRFFANACEAEDLDQTLRQLGEWETALGKVLNVDRAFSRALKKAAARTAWEGTPSLVARIEDVQRRTYVVLAQTWPVTRVKNLFASASHVIEDYVARGALQAAGFEALPTFLAREMPKGLEHIQTLGAHLLQAGLVRGGSGKTEEADLPLLYEAVTRLAAIASFFEPFTSGKSGRRLASLLETLGYLEKVLEREIELKTAQELVADAAAHIMKMKQTKTQTAQIFAAGALTGLFEAQKVEKSEKIIRVALADLGEVKPFWTKIEWGS